MKTIIHLKRTLIFIIMVATGASAQTQDLPQNIKIKEESVEYTSGGVKLKGFVAFDENITGKRPAILIVPEWWGLNEYIRMRARKLAELGYIALAADVFGEGKTAADPAEAQSLTKPFYMDPQLGKDRLDAAIRKIKEFPQADTSRVAAIGYCFGGYVVLNSAKLGADLRGAVSFHGGLGGVPVDRNLLKAKILVCHGASDQFVSMHDADVFKHQLDSIGADYTFRVYDHATHAYSNPDATRIGKKFNMPIEYNADADRDSWNDMKTFFEKLFK